MINLSDFDPVKDQEILKFLETEIGYENYLHAIDRGLDRIRPLFLEYVKKFENVKKIIIGGTNGKGEVAFSLAYNLKRNNKKFTIWSSPHVLSIKERMQSHLGQITYNELQ